MQNHVCKYTHTLNAHVCMRILSRTARACRVACPGKEVRGRQHVSQQFQGQFYWITLQHLTWNFTCRVGEIIPSPAPQSIHVWRYMASQFAFICPKPVPIKPSVLLRKLNSAHISLKTHLQIIITCTHEHIALPSSVNMVLGWYGIVIMVSVKPADLWPLAEFQAPVTREFISIQPHFI